MRVVSPGETVRLWILYQENGVKVSGLTDITVYAKDQDNNTILTERALSEDGTTGEYYYNWNTAAIGLEKHVRVYYKKNSEILCSDELYFNLLEDMDGVAI